MEFVQLAVPFQAAIENSLFEKVSFTAIRSGAVQDDWV
jgi:hypothetical protein